MARTRIKGKTVKFTLAGEEFECDLISAVLERGDAPDQGTDTIQTFCDAATSSGGQVWTLSIEAIQSTDATATNPNTVAQSLHTLIWDTAATTGGGELAFVFMPHGNAAPDAQQPHYTGTVIVPAGGYPAVGGSAGDNSWTWSYQFAVKDNLVTRKTA